MGACPRGGEDRLLRPIRPEDYATDGFGLGATNRTEAERTRRRTKRELRDEERASRYEQLRKVSLSAVYKRLVKELHPDLEPDQAEREKKSRVMQDITAAHARGDLHALLRLELEWIDGGDGDAARLGQETLRAYTELLKQQANELDAEVQSLKFHPRYAPLIVEGPFGAPMVIDAPGEAERLDAVIEQLSSGVERLSSDKALDEVRAAIRAYQELEKREARSRRRRR